MRGYLLKKYLIKIQRSEEFLEKSEWDVPVAFDEVGIQMDMPNLSKANRTKSVNLTSNEPSLVIELTQEEEEEE